MESIGSADVRGDEWLGHPGTVGRPSFDTEVKILDEDARPLPPNELGEIYMRRTDVSDPTYSYLGAPQIRATPDGFRSVGDLGWIDEDGYLFIADRRVDMIVSGGVNIFPAEVENAISEHPAVDDVAVIGLPDEDWGRRVHAVIQLRGELPRPSAADLDRHCRQRLNSYKVPKTYEFVDALPRDEGGKIRRSLLLSERS
jgi:bile acid-coenzyme A ligase